MAANASQALVLRFAADTAPARRAMQDLAQTGVSQVALLAGATAAAGRKIDGGLLGSLARLAAGITGLQLAYASFAAVSAASIGVAIAKLGEYRRLAESANALGVSTDFFQKFTQSAGDAAEKVKVLEQGLRSARAATRQTLEGNALGDRLDEFGRNGGLSDAGNAARLAYKASGTVEERTQNAVRVIDDLLARGRDLEALDVGEKLFGREAADALVERARAAGTSLAEMVNTTADKKVVSPEQVENALRLQERLEAARATMADGMRPIMEDLERLGIALYSGWVSVQEGIAKAVSLAGALYKAVKSVVDILPGATNVGGLSDAVSATMDARVSSLNQQIASLERSGVFDPRLAGLKAQREQAQGTLRAAQGQDMLRNDAVPGLPTYNPNQPVVLGRNDPAAQAGLPPRRPITDLPNIAAKGGGGGGGKSETDTDLEFFNKYVAGIEKASAALKTEIEVQGLSTFEKEKALATSKAYAEFKAKDIELTDEQKARLETLIEAQARLKEQLENTKNAMQAQRDLINFIGSNLSSFFSDMVSGGKNAEQALMNLGKRLADTAFQAMLLGQGPLASLFGTAGQNGNAGGLLGMLFNGFRGGASVPAAATSGFNVTGGVFSFDVGSRYVPRDGLAMLHAGEKVLTRAQNEREQRDVASSARNLNISISLAGANGSREVEEIAMRAARAGVMQGIAGEQQRNSSFEKRVA